jgi:N-methylhydantoinase A
MMPAAAGSLDDARVGTREVFFGNAWRATPLYDRARLPRLARITGPAVIEQADSTTLVEPEMVASGDALGNLILQARA